MHWRRKWQPTPVFLPGESQGQRSLVGCHLWGHRCDLAAAAAVHEVAKSRTWLSNWTELNWTPTIHQIEEINHLMPMSTKPPELPVLRNSSCSPVHSLVRPAVLQPPFLIVSISMIAASMATAHLLPQPQPSYLLAVVLGIFALSLIQVTKTCLHQTEDTDQMWGARRMRKAGSGEMLIVVRVAGGIVEERVKMPL